MSDDAPSNDVLAEQIRADRKERETFRSEIKEALDRIEVRGDRIETRVTETNGRVKRLEMWRMFLLGGFAALSLPAAGKLAALLQ